MMIIAMMIFVMINIAMMIIVMMIIAIIKMVVHVMKRQVFLNQLWQQLAKILHEWSFN